MHWNIIIWVVQIALAGIFGLAGVLKTFWPPRWLADKGIFYAVDLPYWMLRFIGASEIAGAIGLVLPMATGIAPQVTLLAAIGLITIEVLALGYHAMRGTLREGLVPNAVLLALLLVIMWGRVTVSPIGA